MFSSPTLRLVLPGRLCRAAALAFGLACLVGGCGPGEPQVTTAFPPSSDAPKPYEPGKTYEEGKPLPKGMPKTSTTNLKIDPLTGRPTGRK